MMRYYLYIILMKQKRYYFIHKKKDTPKKKPISKSFNSIKHTPREKSIDEEITYNFKKQKIQLSVDKSLQNFRMKLIDTYLMCRTLALQRNIFLLAINILKNYSLETGNLAITTIQTLACLTLSIKFQQQKHFKLKFLLKQSDIKKQQLIGAELYIFQTLSFKIPFINIQQYQQTLQYFITEWNEHIKQNIKDLPESFIMDSNAEYNKQPFRNYINLIILSDKIMLLFEHLTQKMSKQSYFQYFVLGMYYVLHDAAFLINYSYNLKALLSQFLTKTKQKNNTLMRKPNQKTKSLLQKYHQIQQHLDLMTYLKDIQNKEYALYWRTQKEKRDKNEYMTVV